MFASWRASVSRSGPYILGAVALLMLGSLLAPGLAGAASVSPAAKTTITIGTTSDMHTMNPFKAQGLEYDAFFASYDQLVQFNQKDLSASPGLATSWSSTPDQKTWTFTLRSGVKWSDGVPLTASDVAWEYNFIVDNNMNYANYFPFHPTFTAPNATTLIWKSPKATVAPLMPPWIPILPEHIWGKFDKTTAVQYKNVPDVGSGAFTLTEWKPGQFWRLEANPNYWGGAPKVDEVIWRVFDNQEAVVQALKSGEIDFADNLTPALFNSLASDPNVTQHFSAPGYFDNLAFNLNKGNYGNTGHAAIQDLQFRQAIAMGIDKNTIVKQVMLGDGSVGSTVIIPIASQWKTTIPTSEQYPYDPARANALLTQAGYVDTNGDGIRNMPNGGPNIQLDTFALTSLPYAVDTGKLLIGWMKNIGIQINLKPVSTGKAYDLWGNHDWDMNLWGWGPDPDPDFIMSTFTTDSCNVWSDTCWSNPAFDKLYQAQRSPASLEQRKQIVDQMQLMIYQQAPEIILDYEPDLEAYRNDQVGGFVPQPAPNGQYVDTYGNYSYLSMHRVNGSGQTVEGASSRTWLIVVGALILLVLAVVVIRRRTVKDENVA